MTIAGDGSLTPQVKHHKTHALQLSYLKGEGADRGIYLLIPSVIVCEILLGCEFSELQASTASEKTSAKTCRQRPVEGDPQTWNKEP